MRQSLFLLMLLSCGSVAARDWSLRDNPALERWFEKRVSHIEKEQSLFRYESLDDWKADRDRLRGELFDMLGLNPLPERTELEVKVTGTLKHKDFVVEKLWIQTLPGLYVTASFYRPHQVDESLPAILYVCGHARMKGPNGTSFGNKTGYQHHGAWFARNGYVCLTIDTLQLGEIEGIHHGTYRHNRWWWNSRGYTPAGVEAWNCIRALDYLESRSEVDSKRIGVTGRSGGGAYSWWIAALDDRISCAVPVAGIATLRNHVIDGCVEGHCDCMFFVNTHQWDYAQVAALMAPRPLLISNSDKDAIFPLDGVVAIHKQVRHIYELYDKRDALGLQITEGPHRDTQELRIHAFRWMNRWLKQDDTLIDKTATKFFEPAELRVFDALPNDQLNTTIDEQFVAAPGPFSQSDQDAINASPQTWAAVTESTLISRSLASLDAKEELKSVVTTTESSETLGPLTKVAFGSEVPLSVIMSHPKNRTSDRPVVLRICNDDEWQSLSESDSQLVQQTRERLSEGRAVAFFCPRGIGSAAWKGDEKKQIQIRRRFQMIGTTLDTMRIRDIQMAQQALQTQIPGNTQVMIEAAGVSGWLSLLAAATGKDSRRTVVSPLNLSGHRDQVPILLNLTRHLRPEELFAVCAARVAITGDIPQSLRRITDSREWQEAFGRR